MLKGKVAVVTGASRGIGAAIAEKLARNGASVAIIYAGNCDMATAVKDRILKNTKDVDAEIYQCDVSKTEDCKNTVAEIIKKFGVIDILVNNAGITRDGLLVTMDEADFDDVINTNLKGCFNMIKACGRNFIKRKYGKIINISSVSGIFGNAGQANYASSKAGLIALTKVTAREFGGKNVCCNAIAPGFIMTDMTKDLDNAEDYEKSIPLRRLGNPEDVADLALFLASTSSDYITGEVIRVDGGLAI